eukprot:NODE_5217_length_704_cov_17.551145_g4847_i0.p1 GENE.NODE_5217_length_704_cov_17.551145_g4847_i0~~NODE_5217_length_704_cov_17.551145_g4847_i0.p1  ORF type:complete len:179 (+),score=35.86 NODE_5217_length_704_cov_17.551145_g4847_i0:41-538(+)
MAMRNVGPKMAYRYEQGLACDDREEVAEEHGQRTLRRAQHPAKLKSFVQKGFDIVTNEEFGLTKQERQTFSPADVAADLSKSTKPPPISKQVLKRRTVGDVLDSMQKKRETNLAVSQRKLAESLDRRPASTFERVMTLPRLQKPFPKSTQSVITNASEYALASTM